MGWLLTHPVYQPNHQLPPVEHQFQILKNLGIPYTSDVRLELWPSARDEEKIQTLLDSEWMSQRAIMVGINLTASERWATKNWPIEHIARFCDLLAAQNLRVVLTGMEKDVLLTRRLIKLMKSKPANFVGKTSILELAALIKQCRVYVTPDSSPLHIAAAVGTPYIALFGPTDPARHRPPSIDGRGKILRRTLPCSPCYKTFCKIKTHDCMRQITPEEVVGHVKEILEKAPCMS
jgi:ADP-heptose:LPS heptosyltransferase